MRALAAIAALSAFAAYPATPSEAGGVEGPTALVGDAHSVWLADTAGQVRRLDARNGTRRFLVDVGGYPNSLALGVGTLWVATADGAGGSIIRLSPATGRRIGPALHVGSGRPLELAVGDQAAWLVNAGDQRVWRINARTGRVEGATLVSAEPWESATVVADRRGSPTTRRPPRACSCAWTRAATSSPDGASRTR